MKHPVNYSVNNGFSFIELMITISIAAIILGIAIPSFNTIANQITFNSIRQQLILDITFTRSEAISHGGDIVICASTDGALCSAPATATNWSQGWIIFIDNDSDGVLTTGTDELIRVSDIDSVATITWSRSDSISFTGEGIANNASTFRICDSRGDTTIALGVTLNLSGRVRPNNTATCP